MPNKFFNGIGSLWSQLFEDRKTLEDFGYAGKELLTSAYMEMANLTLSISHDDVPVFDRTKWDIVVLKASEVVIEDSRFKFPIPYSLNNKGLRSASVLLPSLVFPKLFLVQNQDFSIENNLIAFNADPFLNTDIPIVAVNGDQEIHLWAPVSEVDTNRIWRYYGHFIKRWNYSSKSYKSFTRGMFHVQMFGPILDRIAAGLQLIAGLPITSDPGNKTETVLDITSNASQQVIRTNLKEYVVAPDVGVLVNIGDVLSPFQPLTDTAQVVDYLIEPNWWQGNFNQLPPQIGTTTDIDKAFNQYLQYNTFLVRVNLTPFLRNISGVSRTNIFDAASIIDFISEFKPSYTYAFPLFLVKLKESVVPKISITSNWISDVLEDKHFGYPVYKNLSSGLNLSSGANLMPVGIGPGISLLNTYGIMNPYIPELYRQIAKRPYNLSDGQDLSSALNLSSMFVYYATEDPLFQSSAGQGFVDRFSALELPQGLFVDWEIPAGTVDGANKVFTLPEIPENDSLELFQAGLLLEPDVDYVLSGATITFTAAPTVPDFMAFYRKDGSSSTIFIDNEVPSGVIDGINKDFTIASSIVQAGSMRMYIDGVLIGREAILFNGQYNFDGEITFGNTAYGYTLSAPDLQLETAISAGSTMRVFYRQYTRIGFVDDGSLTGDVDGINKIFTLSEEPETDSLRVYLNGILNIPDTDYILSGVTVTFTTAPTGRPKVYYRRT